MPLPATKAISPAIFYWGTPVVLITTSNADGTTNIAPMSSAWWLGNRCMLGLARFSHTTQNLLRTKQCILNLASDSMAGPVNALARTTSTRELVAANEHKNPLLHFKRMNGYEYVADKFGRAGLTPVAADLVRPNRIAECPAQMEAELVGVHDMMQDMSADSSTVALEVKILRTHVHEEIRMAGFENRIDPDKWRPLIMSFQQLYGLQSGKLEHSVLARIEEEKYRPLTSPVEGQRQAKEKIADREG